MTSAVRLCLLFIGLIHAGTALGGEVTTGVVYTSDDAAHFGEYSGVHDQGGKVVGEVDLKGEFDWSDRSYWSVTGEKLGLDTYEVELTAGERNRFSVALTFDGSHQFKRGDGRTPFRLRGVNLELPGTWVPGSTTEAMSAFSTTAVGFDQERDRDVIDLVATYRFDNNWKLTAGLSHEVVEGTHVQGAGVYFDASTTFAVLLPVPVDYKNVDVSAALSYTGTRLSSVLSYLHTDFDNRNAHLIWDNPFSGTGSEAVDYPNGQAAISLAPDNDRQQVRLTGSYVAESLRGFNLQWDWSSDRVQQDEPFLRIEALPRDSLDAELTTTAGAIRASYRPATLRRLTLRAGYKLDERDYDKPRDVYASIFANAHDVQRQDYTVGGDLRLPWWRSKLSAEYEYVKVERQNASVEETETDGYRTVIRTSPLPGLAVRVDWTYSDRSASTYRWDHSFFARRTTAFINQTPTDQRFDNHPALSQFHLANAETDLLQVNIGFTGIENWYLSVDARLNDIVYDQTELGLRNARDSFYSVDLQYSPRDDLVAYGNVAVSSFESDMASRSFGGGIEKPANRIVPPVPQGSDPRRNWALDTEDTMVTVAAGFTWSPSSSIELDLEMLYVSTETVFGLSSGGAFDLTSGLPPVETDLRSITMDLSNRLNDKALVTLRYQYFNYEEDDWAMQNVAPNTISNVLGLGEKPDDESVSLVGVFLRYEF